MRLNLLETYIPLDRRWAMRQGKNISGNRHGAVLIADISGFTQLTNRLALELGPTQGAEELTKQLNLIYDQLIIEIHRYQGSVISFAGDAVVCWFDQVPEGFPPSTTYACTTSGHSLCAGDATNH